MLRILSLSCLFILGLAGVTLGQTFSFECVCAHLTGDTCDICPGNNLLVSRSFHGLLIRRNGNPYRWIDEPYTIKRFANETVEFLELIPTPDKIIIARFQTPFSTMQGFIDSTNCVCNFGGGMSTVAVDTPIVGDGSPGNPVTIGQFGADTTMFLNWNGQYWYPAKVAASDLLNDLPYYLNDEQAIAAGLEIGKPYLLAAGNTFALPTGIYKVVIGCGFDCATALKFFISDAVAITGGIPPGREYAVAQGNIYGLFFGFIKSVATDTLTNDSLICSAVLPHYDDDADAIVGGLAVGDIYNLTSSNTYGAPYGMQRVVVTAGLTTADPPSCCQDDATLPYFANDTAAIGGGLASGDYYFLSSSNTLGYPYGSKKRVQ